MLRVRWISCQRCPVYFILPTVRPERKTEIQNGTVEHSPANDNDDADGEYNSDDSGDDDDEESDVEVETVALPEIQVEFEARTPEPTDFDGIKRFLFKLFNNSCKIDYSGEEHVNGRQTDIKSVCFDFNPDNQLQWSQYCCDEL